MIPLYFDVETTGATNDSYGHPFNSENKLCYIGYRIAGDSTCIPIEMGDLPCGKDLGSFRSLVMDHLVVGFNIKFDIHWVRRYGISPPIKIWDCQYAQYCIQRQKYRYPSLDGTLEYWGFPAKLDVVRTEYWEKGIDTDQVPPEVLVEYLEGDLQRTQWVYEAQMNYLADKPDLYRLIVLGNEDILVTQEMEWNGFYYDNEASIQEGQKIGERISDIDRALDILCLPNSDFPHDWNSNDFLSAVLYGGVIKEDYRESYDRVLKDGTIKQKERWAVREHQLAPIVKPIKGSALKKDGFYATSEDVLKKLHTKGTKKVKQIVDLLLERSKIEKLMSTYYLGFPKLYEKMKWTDNIYHPNLNHVVARTGRLTSTTPNEQNIPDPIRRLIKSGYHTSKEGYGPEI